MSDFNHKVGKGEKGLSYIFLEQAKAQGFEGKDVDWTKVMSVFDEIQTEEKAQNQSLFSGGTDKTKAGWGKSYKIKAGDKIELNETQMNRIYEAMGFNKTEKPAAKAEKTAEAGEKTLKKPEEPHEKTEKPQTELEKGTLGEINKFFKDVKYDKKTKQYSARGIKGESECAVRVKADKAARNLDLKGAIYLELKAKHASGVELSKPEESYMAYYVNELNSFGLQLNDKNELVEIPGYNVEKPKKRNWFQRLFGLNK